jgi:hypothetical protein
VFACERGCLPDAQGDAQGDARDAATHEEDDQHCEPAGHAPREKSRDEVARRGRKAHRGRVSVRLEFHTLVARAAALTAAATTDEVVWPRRAPISIDVIAEVKDVCRLGGRATWRARRKEEGGASVARVAGRGGRARGNFHAPRHKDETAQMRA